MATKLKNLRIRKVDFVDEGANPDAHIRMLKKKGKRMQQEETDATSHTGNVLEKLLSFIGKAAGMGQQEIDTAVAQIQKDSAASFQQKLNEAKTRKIADEIWDICFALQSSFCSVLNDEELYGTSAAEAMQASLDEFHTAVQGFIAHWSSGDAAGIVKKQECPSGEDVEVMKSAVERLQWSIQKASEEPGKEESSRGKENPKKEEEKKTEPENEESRKGEKEEMEIDKSKLTDAERAFLESIEKRYGTGSEAEVGNKIGASNGTADVQVQQIDPAGVIKSAVAPVFTPPTETPMQQAAGPDDIYKGLHPAVKAELEDLKKFREAAEEKELAQVAKKYAVIGKKEDELIPMLKGLKAAGGSAYQDMIAVLDHAVDAVEKSGIFSEIGKSGSGFSGGSQAEERIESIAKGYMQNDPGLSHLAAVAKAWEDNPELMGVYEEEAGF